MELREYYRIARRWAWLVILGAILAGGTAFAVSTWITPVYEASVTLRISTPSTQNISDYTALLAGQRLAQTYAQLLAEKPVLEGVAANLALPAKAADLRDHVSVQAVRDTELIRITVKHTNPTLAQAIANEIPKVFLAQDQAVQASRYANLKASFSAKMEELEAEIARLQRTITTVKAEPGEGDPTELPLLESDLEQARANLTILMQNYGQVELAEAQSGTSVTIAAPAALPEEPVSPKRMQNTLLAALAGAMLAAGVAFLVEYLDDSLRTAEDVRAALDLATLGAISRSNSKESEGLPLLTGGEKAHAAQAEAFRVLRTNVRFSQIDRPLRSLLITSPNPVEGKSAVAANLAVALAQAGQRVLLVDSDLRRPRQHKVFHLSNSQGLTDLLVEGLEKPFRAVQSTSVPNLAVLTSGPLPPNPSELLGSQRMAELLDRLHDKVDVVVFDSPPVLAGADAAVLARQVDGTLLLVEAGKTRRGAAQQSLEAMEHVGAHVLGIVLNKIEADNSRYYYYSSHGEKQAMGSVPAAEASHPPALLDTAKDD